MNKQNLGITKGQSVSSEQLDSIEALRCRIAELEDVRERLESQASATVALAEELVIAREKAERARREAEDGGERLRAIVDTVPDAIITISSVGLIERFNPAAERMFKCPAQEMIGKNFGKLLPEGMHQDLDHFLQLHQEGVPSKIIGSTIEQTAVRKDGTEFPIELSVSEMQVGDEHMFTGVLRDITERKRADEMIQRLALNDSLTGLANRNLFQRRLDDALARSDRSGKSVALALVDLDMFKEINDTYGHPVGDEILKTTAGALTAATRSVDTVARLGGDEFALLLVDIEIPSFVDDVCLRIIEDFSEPIGLDGLGAQISCSIGVSIYPNDASNADDLIKKADLALYQVKAQGRGSYRLYDDSLQDEARRRRVMKNEIAIAIATNQFFLEYQPQWCASTDQIVGAEALVRWRHPRRGVLPPGQFIHEAEDIGLIDALGRWILAESCAQSK